MPEPRGRLVTPVGETSGGVLQSLLVDSVGRLLISPPTPAFRSFDVATVRGAGFNGVDAEIRPPVGETWRILAMQLAVAAPAGAASGNHSFTLRSSSLGIDITFGQGAHTARLDFDHMHWRNAAAARFPPDAMSQGAAVRGLVLSNAFWVNVIYHNGTNVVQAGVRTIRFWIER